MDTILEETHRVPRTIVSCCVLHNMCIQFGDETFMVRHKIGYMRFELFHILSRDVYQKVRVCAVPVCPPNRLRGHLSN